jgi:hypothetical protein
MPYRIQLINPLYFARENDTTVTITKRPDLHKKKVRIIGINPNDSSKKASDTSTGFVKSGLHIIQINGKYGLANTAGKVVLDCAFDSIYNYLYSYKVRHFAIVNRNGKFGSFDLHGETGIPVNHPNPLMSCL